MSLLSPNLYRVRRFCATRSKYKNLLEFHSQCLVSHTVRIYTVSVRKSFCLCYEAVVGKDTDKLSKRQSQTTIVLLAQDYTNPDDQPTTKIDSPRSQPTTDLLRTTPTRTITEPTTKIDSPTSQPTTDLLRTTPTRTITEPTTNIDSTGSQPTTVLLGTTPTRTINLLQTLIHLCSCQRRKTIIFNYLSSSVYVDCS